MKVLFVSSGNHKQEISPIIQNQAFSLRNEGIAIDYFTIKGKGIIGYLTNIPRLRNVCKRNKFDIIHAHYSSSAIVATLSFPKIPIIVSFMGSDVLMNMFWRFIVKTTSLFWKRIIVKSDEMKNKLRLNKILVIPNGVDINMFHEIDIEIAKTKLNYESDKKHILFLSDPSRCEKNYKLADEAVKRLNDDKIILHTVFDISKNEVVNYINASDLLLLTSLWEGSPNVIKEAMACNCPIVSTNVGDVEWVIGNTDGCYLTTFDPSDIGEKIKLAIEFSKKVGRTKGREKIIELDLDSKSIASKIINVYQSILNS